MPAITPPTPDTLATWFGSKDAYLREMGVKDGSSPSVSLEIDQNTGRRKIRCKWEWRYSVAQWLVGYSQLYTDSGVTQLSRLPPQGFPFFNQTWFVTKVPNIAGHIPTGYDKVNQVNTYQDAILDLLYEQLPYTVKDDESTLSELERYVEYPAQPPEPGAEYLALPGVAFSYTADPAGPDAGGPIDGKPIAANIGKVIPTMTFQVGWHRLPFSIWKPGSALWQRIFGTGTDRTPYYGAVNKEPFIGFPAGSLLLTGVRPFRRAAPSGIGWELDLYYELGYKPSLWNTAYGVETGSKDPQHDGVYQVTTDHVYRPPGSMPDGKSIYNERAVEDLFQVG